MASPKRSSVALRNLAGTVRPDRVDVNEDAPEFEPIALMPPPPEWMIGHWALDEWHRLGPVLLNVGLLTKANLNAFAQLCSVHGDLATTYQEGRSPLASMIASYTKLVSEFGLTPASASKVRAPDPTQQGNKFRTNGKPNR